MKKMVCLLLLMTLFIIPLFAQQVKPDTVAPVTLQEVVVSAYGQNRILKEIAAPVNVIGQQQLQRYGTVSILPALNGTPGVRMEERSPGSYRLSIRGSSLRSPFGVRNVKIYWNDIPFTDPGGNTYLNQFSFHNFSAIEILKGPGSSLYGAGTGGVMLIHTFTHAVSNQVAANYSAGSFQSGNLYLMAVTGAAPTRNIISFTHQASDGYRQQSAMRRDVLTWESTLKAGSKQSISTHVLFGNLFYQTPGGLTKAQWMANPTAARAAGGGFPGAIDNKAAIWQKTFWAGIRHQYQFSQHWQNTSSVYGAFSQVRNPAIRNYERRLEPHFGARTTFTYTAAVRQVTLKVLAGAEFQQGYATIKVYGNKAGNPDTLQTDDEVNNRQGAAFAQTEASFPNGWVATAGISVNSVAVHFNRLSVRPSFNYQTAFTNELAPRVTLLKKISTKLSAYGLVSKGFSPPTVAELLPSTTIINTGLQAERGINYEAGARWGNAIGLSIDANAFYFRLHDAITQRRDAAGADYFTNAGSIHQQGLEAALNYTIAHNHRFFTEAALWLSYTYFHFRYRAFKQLNNDFSGKQQPGAAPNTITAGIDFSLLSNLYAHFTCFYSNKIALNDANLEYAPAYLLLGFRTGYKKTLGQHIRAEVFLSGDNILNKAYSLGNDINAAGNRFYNAAPTANYQAGIALQHVFSSQ